MALELGESLLEDWLGINATETSSSGSRESSLGSRESSSGSRGSGPHFGDCSGPGPGDEWWHEQREFGVSETSVCKRMLYTTVGDSNDRVWDISLLLPSLLFLGLLSYSSPRTRQQLTGAPLLPSCLHLLLLLSSLASSCRALLLLALPTQPHTEGAKDKVSWVATRTCLLALELSSLLLLCLPCPPAPKTAKRLVLISLASALAWGAATLILELTHPAKEFQVYSLCTSLYGEGGGLYTALTSLLLSTLYLVLLVLHLRNSSRASLLLYLSLLLATQASRCVGGVLLWYDQASGLCLTSLTLWALTIGLPPLVWAFVLLPIIQGCGATSLMGSGVHYRPQVDSELCEGEVDVRVDDCSGHEEDDFPL